MTVNEEMKSYERLTRTRLPERTYTIVRVDGKAFHTFTKGMERPYDATLAEAMNAAAEALCKGVSGAIMAYTQSDEISVLLCDRMNENTQAWYGGQVQKIVSVTASIATAAFNMNLQPAEFALFDSRVFDLPDRATVERYFEWRQRDCIKNSISMTAQSHFSHNDLRSKSGQDMLAMLAEDEKATQWGNLPEGFRMGRLTHKKPYAETITFTHQKTHQEQSLDVIRKRWTTEPARLFDESGWVGPELPA